MGSHGVEQSQSRVWVRRLEIKNGVLYLHNAPLQLSFGRRGVQVGCTFVTYEALDRIYEESQK